VNANPSPFNLFVGVDGGGAPVIATTSSINSYVFGPNQPVAISPTPGAFQPKQAGNNDAILLRLGASGTSITYATYYGGSGAETVTGLSVDAEGNAYVVGQTSSNDLPLQFAFQPQQPVGASAGFFAKMNPSGTTLLAASYFGGQRAQGIINSVALDDNGAIYLSGSSPVSGAPGLQEAPGTPPNNVPSDPATLVKLDSSGQVVQYMWAYSVLGASQPLRVRVDGQQQPCMLASMTLVTPGALLFNGDYPNSNELACLTADGKTLRYATGGPQGLPLIDFAMDPGGTITAAGSLLGLIGSLPPAGTPGAPQVLPSATSDAFIFKLQADNPVAQLFYISPPLAIAGTFPTNFTIIGSGFGSIPTVLWNNTPIPAQMVSASSLSFQVPATLPANTPLGNVNIAVSYPPPGGGASNVLTVNYVNPGPGPLSVTPALVPAGTGATTFTITGGITNGSTVTWNGTVQTATYLSIPQPTLKLVMPASSFASQGSATIVVTNPAPGGGSASFTVGITSSALPASFPTITGPVLVGVGQAGTPITFPATGFGSDVTVVWNGSDRPSSVGPTVYTNSPFGGEPVATSTVQVILGLQDVSQMGTATVQIRSGGTLSPAVTGFIGAAIGAVYAIGDNTRASAFFVTPDQTETLASVAQVSIPSGQLVATVSLGVQVNALAETDDHRYLYAVTNDYHVQRINIGSFAVDQDITLPSEANVYNGTGPAFVLVPGTSDTIIASGQDGVLRILDDGVQRGLSTADLSPSPGTLYPIFATPDAVWATAGPSYSGCMFHLTYDNTGFTGYSVLPCGGSVTGPWALPEPEVKIDAGATYFQSGARTLIWTAPRSGLLDLNNRDIYVQPSSYLVYNSSFYSSGLSVYSLDSEALLGIIPQSGTLPAGNAIPYTSSQILYSASGYLLLLPVP
jgi:hypothetical protein